ncbi:helix-turn-helix transcriptional regulator [Saccharothrix sp. NRRL B-16348]|uniref:helix-turn-helix transcriptional regulator n=1 Tax=Saccharothrix sp. NRRL B-16348 TaxID=1415542 RepID=UPI0006AD9CD5|nr:helix-turn-helix transcriptional regulator [Saccharothrix sp. NRRL B-16348]
MDRSGERLLRELTAATGQGASWGESGAELSRALASVVPHDGARLTGLNPATGFGPASFSFWHGYEADFGQGLLHGCHTGQDPCLREDLARRPVPVDVVAGAGDGPRHRAVRRLFADHGVHSELRLLLRDVRGVWGTLGLIRARDARPFSDEDLGNAARLGPTLAAFLRRYVTAGPLVPDTESPPPGVIVLGPDHEIRAATPAALAWRERLESRLRAPEWTGRSFFAGMSALARTPAGAPLVLGPAASYGRWIACQAERLDADGAGDVAVVIQAATAAQLLPSFCSWYGITARERQVVEQLHAGAAPKHIARRLDLSVHTVNDHLKAVFRKTGAQGRDELIAAIN